MTNRMTKSGGIYVPTGVADKAAADVDSVVDFIEEMKKVITDIDRRLMLLEENAAFMRAAFDQANRRLRQVEKKLMTKRNQK